MISYKCSKCGAKLESDSSLAGQKDTCPLCRHVCTVPEFKGRMPLILGICGGAAVVVFFVVAVAWLWPRGNEPAGPPGEQLSRAPSAGDAKPKVQPKPADPKPKVQPKPADPKPKVQPKPQPRPKVQSKPASLKWKLALNAKEKASGPALAKDGTAYVVTDGTLHAVADGRSKWSVVMDKKGTKSACPAVGKDGSVYVSFHGGTVSAVTKDGKILWTYTYETDSSRGIAGIIDSMFNGVAIRADGTVYATAWGGQLIAIGADGKKKWVFQGGHRFTGGGEPVIAADGSIYAQNWDGFYAVDARGGKKWLVEPSGRGEAMALGKDGTVYFNTYTSDESGSSLCAFSPEGKQKWSVRLGPSVLSSSPCLGPDGTIFFLRWDEKTKQNSALLAFTRDGKPKWSYPVAGGGSTPAVDSNGIIYVPSSGKKLHAVSPSGKEAWVFPVDSELESPVAIGADGLVYVLSKAGTLYAIGSGATGPARSSWPMYQGNAQRTGTLTPGG